MKEIFYLKKTARIITRRINRLKKLAEKVESKAEKRLIGSLIAKQELELESVSALIR